MLIVRELDNSFKVTIGEFYYLLEENFNLLISKMTSLSGLNTV
jgi:hypothetical protein